MNQWLLTDHACHTHIFLVTHLPAHCWVVGASVVDSGLAVLCSTVCC